ncbi:alkaline phosphatase [Thalassotalea sp. HSM 43]|nr:alkaline phosphatase [Thalassotalea sp. HSM 43]
MKYLLSGLALCVATASTQAKQQTKTDTPPLPKNIIMIVADGMGPVYPSAYRFWQDDANTAKVESTIFDKVLVGSSSTTPSSYAKNQAIDGQHTPANSYVTDSAASATALATGVKTYNGAIGVDVHLKPQLTVLEYAKQRGKRTGIAVTSQIVHATPASYIAKNESRRNYNAIADDYLDSTIDGELKADVMLGGGVSYFQREDRNLIAEFSEQGYQYLSDFTQLNKVQSGDKLLGLFAPVAIDNNVDLNYQNPLTQMTKAAVKALDNSNGYFLLVEASQVDWGGHANDMAYAMGEMHDLAMTMEYLHAYVAEHPNTLVVLTADHNTGGMSIGSSGKYNWQPKVINKLSKSPLALAKQLASDELSIDALSSSLGFKLSDSEQSHFVTLRLENQQEALEKQLSKTKTNEKLVTRYYGFIKEIIDLKTGTGWTSTGHTGLDVPVYAFGNGAENFIGHQDNTDIADKIFTLLGKK